MPHYEARLSSKGQITVPVEVREFFGLKEGDRVDFYMEPGSHSVSIMARNKSFADMAGILATGEGKTLTSEEIDQAIGDHLAEKHERISREWNEFREFQAWKEARELKAAE